jgi:uncharacterized membrane protein YgcG
MNTNTVVCLIIAALWAGAATVAFLLALHSRSKLNTENTRLRVKLGSALDLAEKWRMEAARLREPKPAHTVASVIADNLRTLKTRQPAKPRPSLQTPTHPSTSRDYYDDSSNVLAAGVLASTLWSGNSTPDTSNSSSSDSSSSSSSYDSGSSSYDSGSSSSDSGSFSGGDSGSF